MNSPAEVDDFVPPLGVTGERLPELLVFDRFVVRVLDVHVQRTACEVEISQCPPALAFDAALAFEQWSQRLLHDDFAGHLRDDHGKLVASFANEDVCEVEKTAVVRRWRYATHLE